MDKWTTLRSAASCPLTHSPYYDDRPHRSADISGDDQGTSYPDDLQTIHSVLDTRRVNPQLALLAQAGFGGYYWTIYPAEIATDIMFQNRSQLLSIRPQLRQTALLAFAAEDVMRFLGRKLHGNFQGEVSTDLTKRPEDWRIKRRLKGNRSKLYDQFSVLRCETTINNAREFKVLHSTADTRRWVPMGKGVANFWRYYQVGQQANHRYLDVLAHVAVQGEAVAELDSLCQGRTKDGRHYAKKLFEKVSRELNA